MAKLEDYVSYKGSLEDNFINEPLSDYINDFFNYIIDKTKLYYPEIIVNKYFTVLFIFT